ncbi:DUF262 domain-containing protein [Saccharopolyspora indica]|uniref:GmrSD restriction endonuclease domain-containing protein n=1 Tax=Saccharopolyspora indica TaxID=1229659 RepID=UPI0022EA21A7|nr:DUF262 domain-containing protein [Saccharopolyspora indica]MDA3645103.1 DUF262 domain-containing protein [Saccharopolyspora indica]
MKANETTLRNLLQGERQYVVPLYQRPYSWERSDLQQLWSDILTVIDTGGGASHFLGSVVLAPSQTNTPAGVQSWLVVDGQQRLTTLSILLCAIRDHVRDEDQTLAAKIDDLYLFNKYASGFERYTVLPTQADRASWVALLEQAPDAGGEDRIGDAYHFFRKELAAVDDPEDDHDIARIEQAIAGQLSIVEIAAHPDDNVHRIFESLNHTGQPLTQADLLRNYLFMRLPNRADHVYEQQWLPLQKLLDNKQLETLVWLDLVLRGDDRATQEAVYQAQQHQLNKLSSEEEIQQWVTELHRKARLFRKILEPQAEPDPTLRRALQRLEQWGAHVVHPISLHVLIAHEEDRLTSHDAARALRVVESYLVRRMIAGISSTGTNRTLMSLVKDLGSAVPSAAEITKLLSGPRKRFPTDQHIREAALSNNFYWAGRGPQRTYVLRCLEEDYRHGEPVDFSRSKLTIEHVLPQSPTEEWREMLTPDVEDGQTPEELHSTLVHTLGNLTLTAYNNKLANDGFSAKQKILIDSGLSMNREIAAASRWSSNEIRARGRSLAERAIRIWPGPDDSTPTPPPSPRWSLVTQILASIPAGRWTSYSDIAEVIGSHQVSVNGRLASSPVANVHRVLKLNGQISPEFRWPDPDRADDPKKVLQAEGVRFDGLGNASAAQRMSAAELARLIDLDTDVPEVVGEPADKVLADDDPYWDRHSGRDGHRDHPEWDPGADIAVAEAFYQPVSGKAKVFLDLLIDHPGQLLSVDDLRQMAGDEIFSGAHAVAGAITALAQPQRVSGRRYPYYWWQGEPARYAMKPSVAELFQQARTNLN